MNEFPATSIWERLDSLSDTDLKALTSAATHILAEGADDGNAREVVAMPPGPAARELRSVLKAEGVEVGDAEAARLLADPAASRDMALMTLRELSKDPTLASAIEAAWRARTGMMIIDGGLLAGGALLLLVMKLKHVKVKKGETDVEFYQAKSDVLTAIRRFLGQ